MPMTSVPSFADCERDAPPVDLGDFGLTYDAPAGGVAAR
jgi:hypothetical protein